MTSPAPNSLVEFSDPPATESADAAVVDAALADAGLVERPSPAERLKAVSSIKNWRGRAGAGLSRLSAAVPMRTFRPAEPRREPEAPGDAWEADEPQEQQEQLEPQQEVDDTEDVRAFLRPDLAAETKLIEARLPKRVKAKRVSWSVVSFLAAVILPVAVVSVYLYWFASPQYLTEFHLSVQMQQQPAGMPGPASASLASSTAQNLLYMNDNYILIDYLQSQSALDELSTRLDFDKMYTNPKIDWWARMDSNLPAQRKLRYWQRRIAANFDMMTGIATVDVRAFSPSDSLVIAQQLAEMSEKLINDLQARSRKDSVVFFEKEVENAEARLRKARDVVRAFQDKEQLATPDQTASGTTTLIGTLETQLAQLQTQQTALSRYQDKGTPTGTLLKARIQATKDQIASVRTQIGSSGSEADPHRLSNLMAQFDELKQNVVFAQQFYQSAMTSLETARANAAMQHIYVATYVSPRVAETDDGFPRKPEAIGMTFLVCFFLWFVGLLGAYAVRDHAL